jgi:hypothetical protein
MRCKCLCINVLPIFDSALWDPGFDPSAASDNTTKTFTNPKTGDKAEDNRMPMAMNEATRLSAMNLILARVNLWHSDPLIFARTRPQALDEIIGIKSGPPQLR